MAEGKTLEPVTREDLRSLLGESSGPAISLYQPTQRAGKENEGNPLRYKNLLARAEDQLEALGTDRKTAGKLLEPLRDLLGDTDFWLHPKDGFAVLRNPNDLRVIRFDYHVPERVVVAPSVHIVPLLPALDANFRFYILAISMKGVRLLRATGHGVEEVDLSSIVFPRSLAEAMRYDDFEKTDLQNHPTATGGNQGGRHVFHGHGPGAEDQKNEIMRYFQAVDAGLQKVLATETTPLVLAAVDYLHTLYRQASDYRHIVEGGIDGNPDGLSAAQLHARALPLIEPHRRRVRAAQIERCGTLLNTGRASDDLADILGAAHMGRVEVVLLRSGEERWGSFDPAEGKPTIHDEPRPGDEELLDLAARQTLLHGGEAHLVGADELPASTPICAIYRF